MERIKERPSLSSSNVSKFFSSSPCDCPRGSREREREKYHVEAHTTRRRLKENKKKFVGKPRSFPHFFGSKSGKFSRKKNDIGNSEITRRTFKECPPIIQHDCNKIMNQQQQQQGANNNDQALAEKTCINEKCKRTKGNHANKNSKEIRWRKSKVIPGADICQSCYRVETLALADKQCAMCDSRKTNGCWYRSKVIQGGNLCRKCYNKELTKLQNKTCGACNATETTASWYNSHVKVGVSLCHRCYYRERATISTKSCVACGSDKTSGSWLKSKSVEGAHLCVNCYYKELVALSGKECCSCESKTTSSIWYNSKEEKGKHLCAKCYSRGRKRHLREVKEQKEKEKTSAAAKKTNRRT